MMKKLLSKINRNGIMYKFLLFNLFIALIISSTLNTAHASKSIIGGQIVSSHELISKRTVGIFMKDANGQAICSGEIIDASHILTAAHCVNGFESGFVVFSTGNITNILKTNPNLGRKIIAVKAMPGYEGQTAGNGEYSDFSIITFEGGLAYGYEPAHFLPASILFTRLKVSTNIILAGYGITNLSGQDSGDGWLGSGILHKVNVKLIQVGAQKIDMFLQGQADHISCTGDSGGPAMIITTGGEYVVGVDSRGNCHDSAIYGIVTKEMVTSFVNSVSN